MAGMPNYKVSNFQQLTKLLDSLRLKIYYNRPLSGCI